VGVAIPVALDGTASSPAISVSPALGLAFGTIAYGATATLTLTVENVSAAGTVTAKETINGPSYKVLSNTCLAGVTAGNSCTMKVEFDPVSVGNHDDVMTVTTSSGAVYRVPLLGTASQP